MYVRVRDPDTGHHFDVPQRSPLLRDGLVVPVKRYPISPVARPPKHRARVADAPAPNAGQGD